MKIVITLPPLVAAVAKVEDALEDLMRDCGGVTVTQGKGTWVAPDGSLMFERVELYHFCCPVHHLYSTYLDLAKAVARAAIEHAGEQAVLVEYYQPCGYSHTIYTKESIQ